MSNSSNPLQEYEMPMSIITKLIKDGQSDDGNVILSKDVKKAFAQIAGLFSLYLFSTANDICKEKKLKKVSEQQVLQALNELGFDKYQESLKEFLKNYTEKEDEVKKTQYKKRKLQEDEEEHKYCTNKTYRFIENANANGLNKSQMFINEDMNFKTYQIGIYQLAQMYIIAYLRINLQKALSVILWFFNSKIKL